jgi:integrase/recombinase XerD
MPSYTEKIVKMYTKDQLVELMAASSQEEFERHQFFLGTGARDEEVQFAIWKDIDFDLYKFSVKAKPDLGFKTKGRQERSIPIPEFLVNLLKERRKRNPDSRFIFPAPNGGPNVHFLRSLKLLAFRNGMNCGDCVSKKGLSCGDHPVCEHWILHRFRKTFATLHYRTGKVTMKTLQIWLGHKNLRTTMLYLADEADENPEIRASVNNTFAFANGASQAA